MISPTFNIQYDLPLFQQETSQFNGLFLLHREFNN